MSTIATIRRPPTLREARSSGASGRPRRRRRGAWARRAAASGRCARGSGSRLRSQHAPGSPRSDAWGRPPGGLSTWQTRRRRRPTWIGQATKAGSGCVDRRRRLRPSSPISKTVASPHTRRSTVIHGRRRRLGIAGRRSRAPRPRRSRSPSPHARGQSRSGVTSTSTGIGVRSMSVRMAGPSP